MGQSLQNVDAVIVPFGLTEQAERSNLKLHLVKHRNPGSGNLAHGQVNILNAHQLRVELVPKRKHGFISADALLQFAFQPDQIVLAFLDLHAQRTLLTLNNR